MADLAKRTIKDRIAVGDDIFTVTDLGGGKIKLVPAPQEVAEAGTDVNAALLQPLEDARVEHAAAIAALQKLSPPAFYVTVTPATSGDTSVGTGDKTDAEIYAAYAAGRPVFCRVASEGHFFGHPATLPIFAAVKDGDNYMFAFCGSGAPRSGTGNAAVTVTVTRDQYNWHIFYDTLAKQGDIPTVPTAIKNPNALTLKHGSTTVVYDGSAAKTFEVSGEEEEIFCETTTEQLASFVRNTDSAGNEFSLKRWRVMISLPGNGFTAGKPESWSYLKLPVPGLGSALTLRAYTKSSDETGSAVIWEGDQEAGVGMISYQTSDSSNNTTHVTRTYAPSAPLTAVTINGDGGNRPLPVGVKITLKGVRA